MAARWRHRAIGGTETDMDLNLEGKIAWLAGDTGWLGQASARGS